MLHTIRDESFDEDDDFDDEFNYSAPDSARTRRKNEAGNSNPNNNSNSQLNTWMGSGNVLSIQSAIIAASSSSNLTTPHLQHPTTLNLPGAELPGGGEQPSSFIENISALTPIVICGKRWVCKLSIKSLLPDVTTIKMLRETFDIVKRHADEISLQTFHSLLERLPKLSETFAKAGRVRLMDDDWEIVQFGMLWLNATEKCISRANDADALCHYIGQLTKVHNRIGVRSTEIPVAVFSFETAILRLLRGHHKHIEATIITPASRMTTTATSSRFPTPRESAKPSPTTDQLTTEAALSSFRRLSISTLSNIVPLGDNPGISGDSGGNNNESAASNNIDESNIEGAVSNHQIISDCPTCGGWRNFFDLINILLVTDLKE